jgi:hypothetical protein
MLSTGWHLRCLCFTLDRQQCVCYICSRCSTTRDHIYMICRHHYGRLTSSYPVSICTSNVGGYMYVLTTQEGIPLVQDLVKPGRETSEYRSVGVYNGKGVLTFGWRLQEFVGKHLFASSHKSCECRMLLFCSAVYEVLEHQTMIRQSKTRHQLGQSCKALLCVMKATHFTERLPT